MNIPAKVLKNAMFMPRDMNPDNRRYPKIID